MIAAEFIHYAVTARRMCQAVRVRCLNITALFDGVVASVCDFMWLFTAFDNEWNVISCTSAVGYKHSHKTDHRSPPSLYDRTDFSQRLLAFRAASLSSTYPKFLARTSVITDSRAADGLSNMLSLASLLSFLTVCWFYWDKKNNKITPSISTAAWSQQRCCFMRLNKETNTYFICCFLWWFVLSFWHFLFIFIALLSICSFCYSLEFESVALLYHFSQIRESCGSHC